MRELPIVVVPVGTDEAALDACLAALEAGTPARTRVWLADDAQAGPRGIAIIERWLAGTALHADYTRRARPIGEVAHLDEVLGACGDADVAVLAPDARPAPGWLRRLAECFERDAAVASATPWCNAGEAVAWPEIGKIAALPDALAVMGAAAAGMPVSMPELPSAVGHAVLLRGRAYRRVGGLDATSYRSWTAALVDLSLRLAGLGWRNVLCEASYVARPAEGLAGDGDMDRLAVRWPDWHARLARFLMDDPLAAARLRLAGRLAELERGVPQCDLFPSEPGPPAATGPAAVHDARTALA